MARDRRGERLGRHPGRDPRRGTGYWRLGREGASEENLTWESSGPCSNYRKKAREGEKQVTDLYGWHGDIL